MRDPLLWDLPSSFAAYCGHKEAVQTVSEGAVILMRSESCPVQMVQFGKIVYGVQFHTELDVLGLDIRIDVYKDHGYCPPSAADSLKQMAREYDVTVPMEILRRFVTRARTS